MLNPKYAIEINNLSKEYKTSDGLLKALDNIDLKIKRGSFFGLLGPNGAGKSTLINILATIVNKTEGRIKVCEIDFDENKTEVKHLLGIVPQEIILDPFFTVREALEIYAGYFGVPKKDRKTQEVIDALGLTDKADAKPRSLSGGMKRRLLIGKALIHSPEILILDEPTAGVDVELRQQLWDYVVKLNKAGTTIILTTHYIEEAEKLCDEIAIINHGKIIAHDKTNNLKEIFGNQELILELDKKLTKVPEELAKLAEVEINGNQLVVKYKKGKLAINEMLKILQKEKLVITNLDSKESALEEIFKDLVA